MADADSISTVRCQMCSRPNPAQAEACQYCGARIKPLIIRPAEETLPGARVRPSDEASASEATIVGRAERERRDEVLRADAHAEAPRETPAPPAGDEQEGPQAPAGDAESASSVPAWLQRLREQTGGPRVQPPPPAAAEAPDWLKRLREQEPPGTAALGAPEPEAPEAPPDADMLRSRLGLAEVLPRIPSPEPEDEQPPDWLAALRGKAAEPEPPAAPPDWLRAEAEPEGLRPEAQPEGLSEVSPPPPTTDADLPDWLKSFTAEAAPAADQEAPALPDWLRPEPQPEELSDQAIAPPPPEPPAQEPPAKRPVGLPSTEVGEADFEWLRPPAEVKPTGGEGLAPAELPAWLAATRPKPEPTAPAPPPQLSEPTVGGVKLPPELPPEPPPARAEGFLGGLFQTTPEPSPEADIAKAKIPPWLEAMRPIETLRPAAQPVEERVESAGPLAGMRGVLPAEPAVALPHTPGPPPIHLVLSDSQSAQIELLRGLIETEAGPEPAVARRKPRRSRILSVVEGLPLGRWLIFLLLFVAVLTPIVLGPGFFTLPDSVPAETLAVAELVSSLPADRPVLLAFDYDPASTGELDAEAESLLRHVAARGLRVAAVSSRPAGAGVAQEALARSLAGYVYGVNMINLGYVPGGAIGLQNLAASPRTAVRAEFTGADPWSTPALSDVEHLSRFSLIAVVTNSPESIRSWVEQVRPLVGETPMVALISASTEPLVRPYYETQPRQVAGMITGLAGAVGYDRVVGLPGEAARRWDAQSFGLLTAAGLMALGNLVHGVAGLLRRPAEEEQNEAEPSPEPKPERRSKRRRRRPG